MSKAQKRVSLADLIGSRVVDSEGEKVGHLVEIELDSTYRAVKLHIGGLAWLQRLHLARLGGRDPKAIDWKDVAEFKDFEVRLRRTRNELWRAKKG
jgi:sporulation protein YlmC with PRC-barrel domain